LHFLEQRLDPLHFLTITAPVALFEKFLGALKMIERTAA